MITASALLAWLSSFAGGVIVKLVVDAFSSWLNQREADSNAKELGRVTAERDQESAIRQATERELKAAEDAPKTSDDAIKRLEEGTG